VSLWPILSFFAIIATSREIFLTTEHTEHTEGIFQTIFFRVFRVVRGSISCLQGVITGMAF